MLIRTCLNGSGSKEKYCPGEGALAHDLDYSDSLCKATGQVADNVESGPTGAVVPVERGVYQAELCCEKL